MLYRIKFISDEVDGFLRELKIDRSATFLDLNKAILKSCGYADDQMTSFYICNEEWERGQQITREDMGMSDSDEDIYVMADTRLYEFIEDTEQRLEFVFDPFEDRCFYLDVKELIPGENLKEPEVIRSVGEAPVQINEMPVDVAPVKGKKAAAAGVDDFEDELGFGSATSSFNDDELDFEGFEISDGSPY